MYMSSLPSAIGIVRGRQGARARGHRRQALGRPSRTCRPSRNRAARASRSVLHYGIVAPAGTPRPIVDKLNAALREALAAPDTVERMAKDGTEPLPSTPEEYAADIDREETKWSAVVKKSGRQGGVTISPVAGMTSRMTAT